nr:MAG TPA_asm: hypothetical protein [Caudoviricetes sp.]
MTIISGEVKIELRKLNKGGEQIWLLIIVSLKVK